MFMEKKNFFENPIIKESQILNENDQVCIAPFMDVIAAI